MRKIIKIGEKEYSMKASAYTQFAYKNETGRSFLSDIKELVELTQHGMEGIEWDTLEKITDLVLKVAYVMISEADSKQVTNYDDFLKNIDNLYDDQQWILDVILLGCSPISRQLQAN